MAQKKFENFCKNPLLLNVVISGTNADNFASYILTVKKGNDKINKNID